MQARGSSEMLAALCAVLFALLLSPAFSSQEYMAPEVIEGAVALEAEQVIDLAGRHPEMVMVDARLEGDRSQGYIEGSVNLPDTVIDCGSLSRLTPRLDHPLMFYCNGVKCRRSSQAVLQALDCGYTQVFWFRGGFSEWKAKGYPYLNE